MEESSRQPLGENSYHMEENGESVQLPERSRKEKLRKIIQTVILYIGFFSLGLSFSVVGPTLLDLQRNTGTTTKMISYMFTARSTIGLGGAILAGFITDRINHWLMLSLSLGLLGPAYLVIPYLRHLGLMVVLFSVGGAAGAYFDASGNMVLLKVWGDENGPWMQALHFIFGSGALIGPLIAEPFLKSDKNVAGSSSSLSSTPKPESSSIVYQGQSGELKMLENNTLRSVTENVSSDISNNFTNATTEVYESQVHWAYLIIAVCALTASALHLCIAFFCSEIKLQCVNKSKKTHDPNVNKKEESEPEDKAFRIQIILFVFFFYVFYCILEMNYGNYLTMYAVKELGWSEQEGARVTAAYWATFTAGRGLGIILVKLLPPWLLLGGDLVISVASLAILMVFSHSHYMVLWVCTMTLGFGISTIFATGITWTEQYITISGVAGAIFMIAAAGGEMIGPMLIGALFTTIGPSAFVYVMFGAVCVLVVLLVAMHIRAERHGKRRKAPQVGPELGALQDTSVPPETQLNGNERTLTTVT